METPIANLLKKKKEHEAEILNGKKFNLDDLTFGYYDWFHYWIFLGGVLQQQLTSELYSFIVSFVLREGSEIYRLPTIRYLLRITNDILMQFEEFEKNEYSAFTFGIKTYPLKASIWRFLFIKDTLEEFSQFPEKIEYISVEYEGFDEYNDIDDNDFIEDDIEFQEDSCLHEKKVTAKKQMSDETSMCLPLKKENETSNKNKIAVLHYMLRDKIDTEIIVKVANYITNKEYDIANKANNSAYKYIHKPELFREKNENVAYIVQSLKKYGFEIPKELEQPKKQQQKLD